ncbi:Gla-3 [Aphelenchoides besseyi]|nr:Gla-3 [Aphelenchoides besseyi]
MEANSNSPISNNTSVTAVQWKNPALYKSRMCDHYKKKGDCKFGPKCWFAHGVQELRKVPRLDCSPEAELDALAEVINVLPPSSSRIAAETKSQIVYQNLIQSRTSTPPTNTNFIAANFEFSQSAGMLPTYQPTSQFQHPSYLHHPPPPQRFFSSQYVQPPQIMNMLVDPSLHLPVNMDRDFLYVCNNL